MRRQNFDLGEDAKRILAAEAAARFGGNQSQAVRAAVERLARRMDVDDLPEHTQQEIRALRLDLDMADARDVVILAIAQLWQREIGEEERDVLAELDDVKQRLTALESRE